MTTPAALHQEIRVTYRYGVYFTREVLAPANPLLADVAAGSSQGQACRMIVVVDNGLYRHHPQLLSDITAYFEHYPDHLRLACPPLLMPGGERVKNDTAMVARVHRAIHEAGLCRHSCLVAVGGGALIDMAGYAAATAHRGVHLMRIPTTVMAQADASIGVKNGVNAFDKKNFIGTFAPPRAVINDGAFLTTLAPRDWLSGVAEAVKVALIKDAAFFAFLEEQAPALTDRDLTVMEQAIYRCAALHLDHIANHGDPFECGSSRPLDFGHWSAHKLEQLSGFALRHGEAVAVGLALDATYSWLTGRLPRAEWARVVALLERLGLPTYTPELERSGLLSGLEEFREHLGGRLTVMLLHAVGQGREVHAMDPDLIRAAVDVLRERAWGELGQGKVRQNLG